MEFLARQLKSLILHSFNSSEVTLQENVVTSQGGERSFGW